MVVDVSGTIIDLANNDDGSSDNSGPNSPSSLSSSFWDINENDGNGDNADNNSLDRSVSASSSRFYASFKISVKICTNS
jgi:hypothetical protein